MEKVILVDVNDQPVGEMEKMEAHQKAILHRAISVFVVNSNGQWLLQRRAFGKYHSNGLWSNTACSHPAPGETTAQAAHRRLQQEMGMEVPLNHLFQFVYQAQLDSNLTEHELDHVFIGISDNLPNPNPDEVSDFKYMDFVDLKNDVTLNPQNYTVWFKLIFDRVQLEYNQKFSN
ncbi:MAG: isopentenyl-diphosphate Delta-isomerase [Bacteroidales bacterium]|nr:isopentenyl-diphosphate Delta-isomerase [Bacteroidales bacterium]